MSTEMVKADAYSTASLAERRDYVTAIAQAGDLLPRSLWAPVRNQDGTMGPPAPSPAKVLLLAETGSMLGLHPMAALQGIHIIEGKPTLSANLLAAVVRRAGHRLRVTTSGEWEAGTFVARAVLIRSDDQDFEFVVEWTKDRAQRAGLLGKRGPWSSYPEAMAKARAITEVIREGAPDATIVAAYTPEELGEKNVTEDGAVVESAPEPPAAVAAPVAPAPTLSRDWVTVVAEVTSIDELRDLWESSPMERNLVAEGSALTVGQLIQDRKKVLEAAAQEQPVVVQESASTEDVPPVEEEDPVAVLRARAEAANAARAAKNQAPAEDPAAYDVYPDTEQGDQ